MRRLALVATAVVVGALAAPATPAFAHGGDTPDATAYRTEVTGISTPEKGLRVRAVEAGARLELVNKTGHAVEILGYSGEPYLEVRPDGTYENTSSPAAYLNQTLAGDTAVPAGADPTAPPTWRRVSTDTTVRWHDQRAHWLSSGLPPQARADPTRSHRLRDWTVPLRTGVRTFEIRGTLDWVPPPKAWAWWLGAALLAVAVTALGLRFTRPIAAVALITGTIIIAYASARSGNLPLLAISIIAIVAGFRPRPFLLALAGAGLAVFAGFTQAGVFTQAIVPVAGPSWWARTAVLVALGAGLGLAATGVLRLRKLSVAPTMVEA
ncbi:MAG TPA: hypothetical protein VGP57_01465 [Actinoplanes sp.]|nr:hypothetical protein [Actinoplanes sp.]